MGIVFHGKVFDGGLSGTTSAYSLPTFDAPLGRGLRWYITARVTEVTGTGTPSITIYLEHSATGMPSEFKSIEKTGAKVPIPATSTPANTINIIEGSVRHTDLNISVPAMYCRLNMAMGGADHNANVQVWVTARDDV